jgi:XTP/dITP diphosphohydrolase
MIEKSQLQHLVEVMDRLRSSGGCPWDAEQTHESLLTYLIEESYEFIDAVERSDRADMLEELGDILLQVVFHARIASEVNGFGFDIEDVAKGISNKLISRHPHVFSEERELTATEVESNWEKIKSAEKGRSSAGEGVPLGQPALALAAKLIHRAKKHGENAEPVVEIKTPQIVDQAAIGDLLFAVVALAAEYGVDPEQAMRSRARAYKESLSRSE